MPIRYKTTTMDSKPRLSHRKVWIRANGPIPEGYHVHHINHDKFDNRLENLELIHRREHPKLHPHPAWNKGTEYGKHPGGKKALATRKERNARYSAYIQSLRENGYSATELATFFGVTQESIYHRLRCHCADNHV